MNKFEKDILNLIKSALNDTKPIVNDLDYKAILSFSLRHQIFGLLFHSLSKLDDFKNSPYYGAFLQSYISCLHISENQQYELRNLFDVFNQNNIDYVPLKGTILKTLYPKPEMRPMSDADILIKENQTETVFALMKQMGYVFEKETDHEIVWHKNNNINIELQKKLIPSYNEDYYSYYETPWKFLNNGQFIKKEDFFIYHFTHFTKHYRDGLIKLKYIIDFYVLLNIYQDLNFDYINIELEKLNLLSFYKNVFHLINVYFNNGKENPVVKFLSEKIFYSTYDDVIESWYLFDGLKKVKAKKCPLLNKIGNFLFPSFKFMSFKYQFLKNLPFLLPFMYIIRWFEFLIKQPGFVFKKITKMKYYNKKIANRYRKELNYVGLDFNVKKEKGKEK